MELVEVSPTPEQFAYTFGGHAPLRTVNPGSALRIWCEDAFGGALRSTEDRSVDKVDLAHVNPQSGPFHVNGAQPGDTLALHIVRIEPARTWGVSAAIPFFGGLTGTDRTVTLQPPLSDTTWIYQVDSARQTVQFEARHSEHRVELPLEPMMGTVGVAPAGGEVRSSLVPERFGGNMDSPLVRAGTTCYLGVNVDGALFSVGDGHYRQGEGEACGTAVEGAVTVTVIVDLVKGGGPLWPQLETDDLVGVVGSSRPLEDAWRIAHAELVGLTARICGLDPMDAYQLTSQISQAPIANVVDANYSVMALLPKKHLPVPAAYGGLYGGLHAHLRELAAQL